MPEKGQLISGVGRDMNYLAGGGGYGDWPDGWGQEIIAKEIVPRVRPGARVADIASGEGRASAPLALRGAKVIAVDNSPKRLNEGDELREKAGARRARSVESDIRTASRRTLGGGVDVVIASDALNHLPKEDADGVIDRLPSLLNRRRGGLVYVNAPSTESMLFEEPECFGAVRTGPKQVRAECSCSGELLDEEVPFYEAGEIEARLAMNGGQIIRANTFERNGGGVLHEVVAFFRRGTKTR
jgi:SAM-dependent methyltransferase